MEQVHNQDSMWAGGGGGGGRGGLTMLKWTKLPKRIFIVCSVYLGIRNVAMREKL